MKDRLTLQRYYEGESAAGLSTRVIIDSSSYVTTPCDSPPDELRSTCYAPKQDQRATIARGLLHVNLSLNKAVERDARLHPRSCPAEGRCETAFLDAPPVLGGHQHPKVKDMGSAERAVENARLRKEERCCDPHVNDGMEQESGEGTWEARNLVGDQAGGGGNTHPTRAEGGCVKKAIVVVTEEVDV